MSYRVVVTWSVVAVAIGLAAESAAGQQATAASPTWSPPQTSWGDPDLQGTWSNASTTPLERPADLSDQQVLSDEEWAVRNAVSGLSDERPIPGVGFYNDYWLEQGELSKATSLIVDPPDGRLPQATAQEQQRQATTSSSYTIESFTSWEDFNALDRCITRGMPGAMIPGVYYNHNYEILQTPEYVAILIEMVHDVRIIPLDGRAHVADGIRQWLGDARGHWDGDTLVVETTNFNGKIRQRTGTVSGGDENLRVVERFTRTDAGTIDYRVTVHDSTVWTESWTVAAPMTATEGPLYEYACHEGNYAVPNALRGSRAQESARP